MVENLPANAGDMASNSGWEASLEEGMATNSSILALEIPWSEEISGLQSMGSQRVRYSRACMHAAAFQCYVSFSCTAE